MGYRIGSKPCKFFYRILTHLPPEEVIEHIEGLRKQAEGIEQQIVDLAIYSEGAISHEIAAIMSFELRERTVNTLNKKFEKMSGKEYM